jgi:hypothetical protein
VSEKHPFSDATDQHERDPKGRRQAVLEEAGVALGDADGFDQHHRTRGIGAHGPNALRAHDGPYGET